MNSCEGKPGRIRDGGDQGLCRWRRKGDMRVVQAAEKLNDARKAPKSEATASFADVMLCREVMTRPRTHRARFGLRRRERRLV